MSMLKKKCCCGGTFVTIEFTGVSVGEISAGQYYWVACGPFNGVQIDLNYTVAEFQALASVGATPDHIGLIVGDAVAVPHPSHNVRGEGFGFPIPTSEFDESWWRAGIVPQVELQRTDDGYLIEVSFGVVTGPKREQENDSHGLLIFRGIAPYVASGSTVASNTAGGWDGTNDSYGVYGLGSGGTATLRIGTPDPGPTPDAACLCDGIVRARDCIDLIVGRQTIAGSVTYFVMFAFDVVADSAIIETHAGDPDDPYGDPPEYEIVDRFYIETDEALFTRERSDCCSVLGMYGTGGTTLELLLAADVEAAHCVAYFEDDDEVPIFNHTFDLIRKAPEWAQFEGVDSDFTMHVILASDAGATPVWRAQIRQLGTLVLTATRAFAAGGASVAGAYTIDYSTVAGLVGETLTVTT